MGAQNTLQFFTELADNNNREWFEENKPRFRESEAYFRELVQELIDGIAEFDPRMAGTEAKKCVFRIYRDVRFSKNKAPYKTGFGANMSPGGRKSNEPGYYIHLEPNGQTMIGGGMWQPESDHLFKIRQEIDYHPDEFQKLIESSYYQKHFKGLWSEDKLKMAPKGFDKTLTHIDMLKYKSYLVSENFSDAAVSNDDFLEQCLDRCKEIKRLIDFLVRAGE